MAVKNFDISDEEAAQKAQNGDEQMLYLLITKYMPKVRMISRKFFIEGSEFEDVAQEGAIGLYKAILTYKSSSSSFSTYAHVCIRNNILTAVKTAAGKKHISLNSYVSLPKGNDTDFSLIASGVSPEDFVLSSERVHSINSFISNALSSLEKRIFVLYISGISYKEIALKVAKNPKAVDNAVARIKKKLLSCLIKG